MTDNDSSLSDESLARLARNGDLATFEVLVRRYEGRLYRFSLHWCGNESDARDLVQEIFVAAYLGLPGYKPSVPFASWLFTIARNKCIDKSRCRTFTSDTETEAPEMASQDTPASLIEQRDDAEYLWRLARLVLTNTQFQSLWLHYVEDMTVAEIARVMHRPQQWIKVTLFRARKKLARVLRAQSGAPQPKTMFNVIPKTTQNFAERCLSRQVHH